jgi:hypothetical protein
MTNFRKIMYFTVSVILAACATLPGNEPEAATQAANPAPVETETPIPVQPPANPGTLADSIPAALWKGSSGGNLLVPLDPSSGQALQDYAPISLGQALFSAYSLDNQTLAVVGFVSSDHPHGGSLHLIDLKTWDDQVQELQLDSYVNAMNFSPDGKQLAIAYGNATSQILVLNVAKPFVKSKSAVVQVSLDFLVNKMKFTSYGSGLMTYGFVTKNPSTVYQINSEPPIVVLLDSTDLSEHWRVDLEGIHHGIIPKDENSDKTVDLFQPGQAIYLFPGLAFDPNRDILYVVHPDEDKLTTVDFAAQKVATVEIKPQLSWIEQLLSLGAINAHAKVAEGTSKSAVISPNGQFLYVVGQRIELAETEGSELQVTTIPLGLQIVRTKDGSRVAHYDTDAQELSISADGRYLYLRTWGVSEGIASTQIFDTSTNKIISRLDGTWLVPTRRVDGRPILGSNVWMNDKNINHNSIVDPQNLSVLSEWDGSDSITWSPTP